MISEKTKKYFSQTVNKAHALRIFSFSIKNDTVHVDGSILVKLITAFCILTNFSAVVYFSIVVLFLTSDLQTALFLITAIISWIFCMGCQIWHLTYVNEICQVTSHLVKFFNHLGKSYCISNINGDSIGTAMRFVYIELFVMEAYVFPIFLFTAFFSNSELARVSWMPIYIVLGTVGFTETWLNLFSVATGLIAMVFVTLSSLHGLYNIFLLVNLSLLYTDSTYKWIKYYSEKLRETISADELETLQLNYAAHQILHTMANTTFPFVVEFVIDIAIILAVFCSCVAITSPPILLFKYIACVLAAMDMYLLRATLLSGIQCHTWSKECCCIGATRLAPKRMYNQRYWKSRQPISVRVGGEFKLETTNYVLIVFGDIIATNVINLLVAF